MSVYKNMFGGDCVMAGRSKEDDGERTYACMDFINGCNQAFTVRRYVNDVFRGTCFVKAVATCGGTIIRADVLDMSFSWEP